MKVSRERELDGLVIQAETPQESEVLTYLWCNHARMQAFDRKDGLVSLTIGPDTIHIRQEEVNIPKPVEVEVMPVEM